MSAHRQHLIQHRNQPAKKADIGKILVISARINAEFFRPQLLR
jgi:hypothetical protein